MKRISVSDPRVISVLKWFSVVFNDTADSVFEQMFLCKIVEIENQYYLEFNKDCHFYWFVLSTTNGERDTKYVHTFDFDNPHTLQCKELAYDNNRSTHRERIH